MKKSHALIIIVLLVVGCAAGRTQIIQPKKVAFQNYPVLEITDFKNNAGPQVPTELLQRLPNGIAEKVTALNLFQAVNRIPIETESTSETKTLLLKGTIIEYEPGSQGKRWLAGFTGYGKAFTTFQLTAIDKIKKEEIFKGNIGGELSGGLFGGSFDEVIEKLVDECVECIQMNY